MKQEGEKGRRGEREKGRKGEKKTDSFTRSVLFSFVLAGAGLGIGCQANQQIMNSAPPASPTPFATAATRQNSVEQEIRDMETVGFKYVFVLRRRDGGVWDAEDRKYLRQNTPPETNRFVSVDGDKAFVVGSAYRLAPEDIDALKRRFDLEDVSKPEPKNANANQAATANQAANANQAGNADSANGVNQSTANK